MKYDYSFVNNNDGINTRVGAELLVENNVFESVGKPLYSTDSGFANASGNDFGGASSTAETSEYRILRACSLVSDMRSVSYLEGSRVSIHARCCLVCQVIREFQRRREAFFLSHRISQIVYLSLPI